MISLKNVKKEYMGKGGKVCALKGIDIDFDNAGMTFVLGKSGHGKTTLLNLIGGLDKATEGEVFVDGRDINKFTPSEFDSYRNTFVGFVFQEYNLLDDYTVFQNISLATELQAQKADSEAISDILAKVGLDGYEKRLAKTLSGGEKQRLAIARAIIKKPCLIIADEPTGSLDSETSQQIFQLLKEVSKETLTIVVSHDKEYATEFGDRIIELRDGKIASDYKKEETQSSISNQKDNKKQTNLIQSKLPLRHCLKIALSGLKLKPVRLVASILVIALTFSIFGIADSIYSYDRGNAMYLLMKKNKVSYACFEKEIRNDDTQDGWSYSFMLDEDIEYLQANNKDLNIKPVIYADTSLSYFYHWQEMETRYYDDTGITGAISFSDEDLIDAGFQVVAGRLPQSGNGDEIAITKYIFEHFQEYRYIDKEYNEHEINDYDDLINQKITLRYDGFVDVPIYTIVGIIDTKLDKKFERLKTIAAPRFDDDGEELNPASQEDKMLTHELRETVERNYHTFVFFSDTSFEDLKMVLLFAEFDHFAKKTYGINGMYSCAISPLKADADYKKLAKFAFKEKNDARYPLLCPESGDYSYVEYLFVTVSMVCAFASAILALLSAVILFGYLSMSISHKKKEIGIMRALGARSIDVFKIFVVEGLVIAAIGFVFAFFASFVGIHFINAYFKNVEGLSVSILSVAIRQIFMMISILFGVVVIATLLNVYKITKLKPIDAIRN